MKISYQQGRKIYLEMPQTEEPNFCMPDSEQGEVDANANSWSEKPAMPGTKLLLSLLLYITFLSNQSRQSIEQ
jgi:hypothetical protein